MVLTIIIIFIILIGLLVLHELGHFIVAKKFGVSVEEFGIGYPPRIFGKKIGDTIYSLNWLPLGAFVKIIGADTEDNGPASFSKKPIWQRVLIILAGVVSFWLVAIIIYTVVLTGWGMFAPVDDAAVNPSAAVFVTLVLPDSPAYVSGIKPGDEILKIGEKNSALVDINQASQVQDFVQSNKGSEIVLSLLRGNDKIEVSLTPRTNYPSGEGPMGIGLLRAAKVQYPWYTAAIKSTVLVFKQSELMVLTIKDALVSVFSGKKVEGLQIVGPIGIGSIMNQAMTQGIDVFLSYVGMIAVWMALFNVLPIPALDGGRFLFLVIEAIARKPVPAKIDQTVNSAFFILFIALGIFITIKDIIRLF